MPKYMNIALLSLLLIAFFAGSTDAQPPLVGDLYEDQRVDSKDLRILAWQWLDPGCLSFDCTADLDGVNGVNMADFALLAANWYKGSQVVINEIHYDPAVKTELSEFVELHNAGTTDADISGWYFSEGISYEFPPDTILHVGDYIVVAQDPATIQAKFGTPSNLIFGPFTGRLENDGEAVELRNEQGFRIDIVDYRRRFPWPIVGDPPGNSIELSNPHLDNDLGGSWRPSEPEAIAPPTTIIYPGATWRYFKGYSEASDPTYAWRETNFADSSWPTGDLFIGYGEDFITTELDDMRYNYSCVFLRKTFDVGEPCDISNLRLELVYDDGFNSWINGTFVKGDNVAGQELPYYATAGVALEDHDWKEFYLRT